MVLLIITQRVDKNDDILGFFHRWLEEFAKQCEKIIVVALGVGQYDLPENVKVLSLGKEQYSHHSHIIRRLVSLYRFYKYIWRERKNYDAIFVHMNPVYVVLGGLFWKLRHRKILLWYIHPKTDKYLRLAHFFTDKILTATQFSFPFQSDKILITGHGIDVDFFKKLPDIQKQNNSILYVGRISPIKNLDVLIDAVNILHHDGIDFILNVVGGRDERFLDYYGNFINRLKHLENIGKVKLWGAIPNKEMAKIYNQNEILVNLTQIGSFDKSILEAMACGTLVLVSNKSFENILPPDFLFAENNYQDLAAKMKILLAFSHEEKEKYGSLFRHYAAEKHSLEILAGDIVKLYETI